MNSGPLLYDAVLLAECFRRFKLPSGPDDEGITTLRNVGKDTTSHRTVMRTPDLRKVGQILKSRSRSGR
jgi:hypothetical protein